MDSTEPRVLPAILEQHVEEASSLWLLRDRAVYMPHYTLADLAALDERVEAHLDGLRIGGVYGWEMCLEALVEEGNTGHVFAAAVLAFGSADEARIKEVLERCAESDEHARGLVSALGWLPFELISGQVEKLHASQSPTLRRAALAAFAVHRRNPGQPLLDALADRDISLRSRALRAAGELGLVELLPLLLYDLNAEEEERRFWAAWSATLLAGQDEAVRVLKSIADSDSPRREDALQMALRRMNLQDIYNWIFKLCENPSQYRLAVSGAGVVGDPVYLPWLVELMEMPALARIAGESFSMITGADIVSEHLDAAKPEEFESGPTENAEDEDVEVDPDEHLAWPDPALIRDWLITHESQFQTGYRHLQGQLIHPAWLYKVIRQGRQRARAAAALEMAIKQTGRPLFEIRAPGFRQI